MSGYNMREEKKSKSKWRPIDPFDVQRRWIMIKTVGGEWVNALHPKLYFEIQKGGAIFSLIMFILLFLVVMLCIPYGG